MSAGRPSQETAGHRLSGDQIVRGDLAVVLCTYNGGEHVGEQMDSILAQTVLPGTLRVYDDGSTDDTLQVVSDRFARRPAAAAGVELVVLRPDGIRRGAAGNFARGMRETTTELIALADQDDVWRTDRLKRALDVLDERPEVLLVASNAAFVDGTGRSLGRTTLEAQRLTRSEAGALDGHGTLAILARRNIVPGMTFTIRRGLIDDLGELPRGVMHDYRLALQAAARGGLVVLTAPLVDYRIHGANAIGLDPGDRGLRDRLVARWRLIRSPLSDLQQWIELVDTLRGDDPAGHLSLAVDKLQFERLRRFPGLRGARRATALIAIIRSGGYSRFDVGGWRGAVKDALRPRASDLPA